MSDLRVNEAPSTSKLLCLAGVTLFIAMTIMTLSGAQDHTDKEAI